MKLYSSFLDVAGVLAEVSSWGKYRARNCHGVEVLTHFLLIISNKTKIFICLVTYKKQKLYICEKFYLYETKNIRKNRVF